MGSSSSYRVASEAPRGEASVPMSSPVFAFDSVLVRRPSPSVVRGLRAGPGPDPSYEGVVAEHDHYVEALRAAGVEDITVLPALEAFPDSVFVEDPALVFSEGAILLRPAAPTRSGEVAVLAPELRRHFDIVQTLPDDGFVDGGDVLLTPHQVIIGLSARTDEVGARHLAEGLARFGKKAFITRTPKEVLHFKTACSLLDEETLFVTEPMSTSEAFRGMKKVLTPPGEEAAANALRVNDTVLVGAQFPQSCALLRRMGYRVAPVPTEHIARVDAGLSCMSLRWMKS